MRASWTILIFTAVGITGGANVASAATAAAPAKLELVDVAIDRGQLTVEWSVSNQPYHLEATVPHACPGTKLSVISAAEKLTVTHAGTPCSEPTRFVLVLSESRSVNIKLGDGSIITPNLAEVLANVQQLHASVTSGRVASSQQSLVPTPSHDYFSMAVNWAGGPTTGISVDLDMKSGAIQL